jgi:transcriptional regulator of acetoin/glycerol metabolism
MTFGIIKSLIENNLLESYKNEQEFKKSLREFKHNVLSNKSMSRAYAIYDQLSSPQGLSEQDSKIFIEEGVNLLNNILPSIKLPTSMSQKIENKYKDIDILVYSKNINLLERVEAKKNIINVLTSEKESIKESVNIPISSMVTVANQTISNYIESLDETTKKEFFQIVSEDSKTLENKFQSIKENAITKLTTILENEDSQEMKNKISETIEKIKIEKFDQINFLKLKNLEESI